MRCISSPSHTIQQEVIVFIKLTALKFYVKTETQNIHKNIITVNKNTKGRIIRISLKNISKQNSQKKEVGRREKEKNKV